MRWAREPRDAWPHRPTVLRPVLGRSIPADTNNGQQQESANQTHGSALRFGMPHAHLVRTDLCRCSANTIKSPPSFA